MCQKVSIPEEYYLITEIFSLQSVKKQNISSEKYLINKTDNILYYIVP